MSQAFPIAAADTLPLDVLTAVWNQAYEGYFVTLHFTPEMLARHMARAGVDLRLSCVLHADGAPAGISLAAQRGSSGYIAGFGIAAAQRRRGAARALIQAQLTALQQAGVRVAQLEVIEQNPARTLYREAGFADGRRLLVLDGLLPAGHAAEVPIALDEPTLQAAHRRLNADAAPTWRRQWPGVAQVLKQPGVAAFGIGPRDAPSAYAVVQVLGERVGLLDAGAANDEAARQLLLALARHFPQQPCRLVDEPEHTPIARTALAQGLRATLGQMEMQRCSST